MKFIKNIIRFLLAKSGYQLKKIDNVIVHFDAFSNLASAYEASLGNGQGVALSANKRRIELLGKLQGTPPTEAYSILEALTKCRSVPGDVCEFGVAEGETSALIANELIESEKSLHLFDSFEGLPAPTEKDELIDDIFGLGSMQAYQGKMSFPEASVRRRLNAIEFPKNRTIIHRGFIDRVIGASTNLPTSVSVAYVDFDFYEPILVALNFLDSTTKRGAIIVVDDYGFFSSGAKLAVDEWLESMNAEAQRYQSRLPNLGLGKYIVLEKLVD